MTQTNEIDLQDLIWNERTSEILTQGLEFDINWPRNKRCRCKKEECQHYHKEKREKFSKKTLALLAEKIIDADKQRIKDQENVNPRK